MISQNEILLERGFGSAYFDDWTRKVLAVTLLQDNAIILMKHQPPKRFSGTWLQESR